jgi:hypothetical protein
LLAAERKARRQTGGCLAGNALFNPYVLRQTSPSPARTKATGETMTAQTAARHAAAPQTPPLPQAKPESLGLSSVRLQRMSDAFKREIDKGTIPGVTVLVARRGQIGWFDALGKQNPAASTPMAHNSIFRIFSMTKPIVSVGIMMLLEEGHLLLNDPIAKFIPEFSDQKVGVENNGKLDLVALTRPITIQDLLRHTSGITYDHTGNGLVQQLYQQSRLRSRKITNAEHAMMVASLPLMCQPGTEWNYSRSTDILGRLVEVVSGKTLGAFPNASSCRCKWPRLRFIPAPRMRTVSLSPSRPIPGVARKSSSLTCSTSPRWNPAAAGWSRPRWIMGGSARCCSMAACSTATGSSAARRCN